MKRFLQLLVLFILFPGIHFSQEYPQFLNFSSAPWNTNFWYVSFSLPYKDPYFLDAVMIPYRLPMETSLIYSYSKIPLSPSPVLSYKEDYRYNYFFNPLPVYNYNSGFTFLYRKKSFSLNLNLALQMMGNTTGISFLDYAKTSSRISYRIPKIFENLDPSIDKLEVFLELGELHFASRPEEAFFYSNPSSKLLRSVENTNQPGILSKYYYASPGLSLTRSSTFILEGQVRVPMNAREASRTLDDLWAPEIQTHLGMKYIIPVTGLGKN